MRVLQRPRARMTVSRRADRSITMNGPALIDLTSAAARQFQAPAVERPFRGKCTTVARKQSPIGERRQLVAEHRVHEGEEPAELIRLLPYAAGDLLSDRLHGGGDQIGYQVARDAHAERFRHLYS
jgi:hypothetical protein